MSSDIPDLDILSPIVADAIPWKHKFEMIRSDQKFTWVFRIALIDFGGIYVSWEHDMGQWSVKLFEEALYTVLYKLQDHIDTKEVDVNGIYRTTTDS